MHVRNSKHLLGWIATNSTAHLNHPTHRQVEDKQQRQQLLTTSAAATARRP